ncbi:diacylglycerol kinase [Streptomyces sp. NPDC060194]|uniref:diacylglycerol kinase n=1 Tax=Streptomyces sp. NPDC060194 TaxID=3347069 RepID=UPI00364E4CA4
MSAADQLLVVIDPVARRVDGESVRIAKDVLCAGAQVRVCVPDGPEEFVRALGKRGSRRLVVVGDDRALVRAVSLLHRERDLAGAPLALVPVGPATALSGALGVPPGTVAAARSALEGAPRVLDLLADDSDGVVLGSLRVPDALAVRRTRWSLRACLAHTPAPETRLRVEADGELLCDLDGAVRAVLLAPADGAARVAVQPAGGGPVRQRAARTVTVSGPDFRYRADAVVTGPVRKRTWTVLPGAWSLALPS